MADQFKRIYALNRTIEANEMEVTRMQETLLTMTPEAQEKQQKQIASCNLCIERLHALITALRGGIVSEIEAAENAMDSMK